MGPRQTASILRAPNVLHYSQGPLFNLKKKKKNLPRGNIMWPFRLLIPHFK